MNVRSKHEHAERRGRFCGLEKIVFQAHPLLQVPNQDWHVA